MTEKEQKLISFAVFTLAILEQEKEWSADTTDDISYKAMTLDLAEVNEDGEFTRK